MKYLIILPSINADITYDCLNSFSDDLLENVLVINNNLNDKDRFNDDINVIHVDENIGVPRAWNIGADKVLSEEIDYLILMSASIRFEDGGKDLIKYLELNTYKYGMETQHAWHLICIGRPTLELIGKFDENFYPAYYEDSDYIRRMELAGIHNPMSCVQRFPKVDIKANCIETAHGLRSGVKVNMIACLGYFKDKWGNEPRYDKQFYRDLLYKYPFNSPNNDLKYFPAKTINELKIKYNLIEEKGE